MSTSVMEPALRPTIIILVGEIGDRVNRYLSDLASRLDEVIRHGIAVIRYDGANSKRISLASSHDDDGSGMFGRMIIDSLLDLQDIQNLDRIQRAGIETPNPQTQLIVVSRGSDPWLRHVIREIHQALAAAALELGATSPIESPVLCLLSTYGATPSVSSGRVETSQGEEHGLSSDIHRSSPDKAHNQFVDASGHNGWKTSAGSAPTDEGFVYDLQAHELPATFQFLYPRLHQSLRAILPEGLIEYIMAEAVFSLAATGLTLAPSMAEVVRATPGVPATMDRVGSLGACMVRFPRAEVERYCFASLGSDLLPHWSERERVAQHGPSERAARDEAQREAAYGFVNDLLMPWVRNDILDDMPEPGPDGWPDADAFSNNALDAARALFKTRDRMANALAREQIDRRINGLDRTGREWRRPEWLGERWKEVTAQAWRDYEEIHQRQLDPVIASAYLGVGRELTRFLDQHVNGIWLNPDQGWEAAEAYAEALGEALYGALDVLARDRMDTHSAYEQTLQWYETRIAEAYRGIKEEDSAVEEQNMIYTPIYRGLPAPEDAREGEYHVADSDLYGESPYADEEQSASDMLVQGSRAPDEPQYLSEEEREEHVLRGMSDLNAERRLNQRIAWLFIALSVISVPALTLIALALVMRRWPISVGLLTIVITGSGIILGAIVLSLWLRARGRAEEAMALHVALMEEIARRRQQDLEDQFRVYVVNQALSNVRDMREHLRDWPGRVQRLARRLREQAQETNDDLFDGPASYHDILIANGVRLIPPTRQSTGPRDRPQREESPLWPVYMRFSDDRLQRPREPWHSSFDSILGKLLVSLREEIGEVIRVSDEEFEARLMGFLLANFHSYVRSEIGHISTALDPLRNPAAVKLWADAREHAIPPHGAPDEEILYIIGQREDVRAIANLGVERATERITTHVSQPQMEWLLVATLRK